MSSRIVLFGATGYTGRHTLDELLARGVEPVIAARSRQKLDDINRQLGRKLPIAVADVSDPASVRALVRPGDVLVTTVGPFARWGRPAVDAALAAGAHYIDSTGEPGFVRDLFEHEHRAARDANIAMLPAMGYDYVPGNLAGALALREAGHAARRLEVGYFMTGGSSWLPPKMSGGTRASLLGATGQRVFTRRGGRLVDERGAQRVAKFTFDGASHTAFSIGASEQLSLARLYPEVLDVDVYLGWFGPMSYLLQGFSAVGDVLQRVGPVESAIAKLTNSIGGSTGGPDEASRDATGSHVVARVFDGDGTLLAEVQFVGVNGYVFTFRMLAWSAIAASAGDIKDTGVLGPVEAFGLDPLAAAMTDLGLRRI